MKCCTMLKNVEKCSCNVGKRLPDIEFTISVCVIVVSASVATALSTTVVITFVAFGVGYALVSHSHSL